MTTATSLALPTTRTGSDIVDQPGQDKNERHFLSVHSAHIEATDTGSDGCEKTGCSDPGRVKQQLIYRLGLVFYELFSGCEKPPPELLVNPSFLVETHKDDDHKISTSFRGLDFARSLHVHDYSKADGESNSSSDPSIQNDLLGFAERPMAEDLNEKCNRLRSWKRQSTFQSSLRYSEHSEGNRDKKAALCRVITQVSIEKLKLKGLPGSLSNLIYNMIDCINGDFKGDHSYSNVSDVTSDLRLMVEYPDKFLQDLDVNTLSLTPLRSASGSPEIALIAGESGTGKTWLANHIGQFILSNGGIFLQGKFDQFDRAQPPFSVLATAFNAYCDILIQETDRDQAKLIASKLQDALGPDACQLAKVITTLRKVIVCVERKNEPDANQNYIDAEKRLYYLMCRFVETISRYSYCVIALFLDDLQWADYVSISIVGEILKSSDASERFFFLGSYRDDEIDNGHPVLKMIENVQSLGVTASTVKLRCMDKDMVTRMLSHLLCLSPLAHRRWEWNEENIMSRSLPDDVAVLFSQRINKLPSDVKLALNTLSCFGASVEVDVIKELETKLGDKFIDPLVLAEKEGMLFVAVGQINLGGPSAVSNYEQRLEIVHYNLAAGKLALDMSEFHSAFNFFDNGITFLKKTHWRDHYDLSLELYELAAECALITGDMFSLTVLSDQVTKNARCFEDTLNISYICMLTLSYTSKINDALQMGLEVMSKLGEELPGSFSYSYIELQIKTKQAMLNEMSLIDLLNYRMMTDKKKIMAMKFLRRLYVVAQQVNPNLLNKGQSSSRTCNYGLNRLSSWTFENKYFLLEAEEQFSKNKLDLVRATYDKAISSAKAHKLVHEEAIAYELAANFYFNTNDFSTSLKYYTSAHEKYSDWGAYAKARRLFRCIENNFTMY
eukprot:CCRYP_009906-RA/>CCRYP_009906-RA protein AED:0.32 eAED:0.10 QI:0/0/0/1/0.83/0.85/7/0/895